MLTERSSKSGGKSVIIVFVISISVDNLKRALSAHELSIDEVDNSNFSIVRSKRSRKSTKSKQ